MKSISKSIAFASLALTLLLSCAREEIGRLEHEDGLMELTVTGVLGDYEAAESTKASLVNTLRVNWTTDDIVHVFQKSDGMYLGPLKATAADGGKVATLSGTINFGSGTLVFVYSNTAFTQTLTQNSTYAALDISLASQGDAIPFVLYGTADYPGTTPSGLVVNFSFATSVVSAYASDLPASTTITEGSLVGSGINTVCSLDIKGGGAPSGNTVGTIKKTAGLGTSNPDGQAMVQFAVPSCPSGGRMCALILGGVYGAKLVGTGTLSSAMAYSAIAPMKEFSKEFSESVRIGGRFWSTKNIGATTVNDYGDYYSWGETETKMNYESSYYSQSAKNISANLSETNDVACVNWSLPWRMPTKDDFVNLDKACGGSGVEGSPIAIASSHIEGGKVKKGRYWLNANQTILGSIDVLRDITAAGLLFSDGENYLFFPAAGYSIGTSPAGTGTHGDYWSSTWYSSDDAYYLYFNTTYLAPDDHYHRYYGRSVRPVCDL